jgi:hypothetical protein
MRSLTLSLDRSAEIHVDARIKIIATGPPAAGPQVTLSATFGGITSTHTGATHMTYTLPADKTVKLQIAYVDANGHPAAVDGIIAWESSDPSIAYVESLPVKVGAAGSVVQLLPGNTIGNCQISAKADADMGEGVRELITLMDVTVVGGEAVAGTITPVGELTPKP